MDEEPKVDEIKEELRKTLKEFIGEAPQPDVLKEKVGQIVQRLFDAQMTPRVRQIFHDSAMVNFGLGSAKELEKLLKEATDQEIDWLWGQFGEALQLVKFEYCLRHDMILSWRVTKDEWTKDGSKETLVEFEPKKPLKYIKIDLTLETKDGDKDVPDPSASG